MIKFLENDLREIEVSLFTGISSFYPKMCFKEKTY